MDKLLGVIVGVAAVIVSVCVCVCHGQGKGDRLKGQGERENTYTCCPFDCNCYTKSFHCSNKSKTMANML